MVNNTPPPGYRYYKGFLVEESKLPWSAKSLLPKEFSLFSNNSGNNTTEQTNSDIFVSPLGCNANEHILDAYKLGWQGKIDEDELLDIAEQYNKELSSNDKLTILTIYDKPTKDKPFGAARTYDREGNLLSTIPVAVKYDIDNDRTDVIHAVETDGSGRIILTNAHYQTKIIFDSLDDFKNNKPKCILEFDRGFLYRTTDYRYRDDGTLKSKVDEIGMTKKEVDLYDSNGNDSCQFVSEKYYNFAKYYTSLSSGNVYYYDKNGELRELSDFYDEDMIKGIRHNNQGILIDAYSNIRVFPGGLFDSEGNVLEDDHNKCNGIITDNSLQLKGICYFLGALNTILNLKDGSNILSNLITKNPDGSCVVKFPGLERNITFSADDVKYITDNSKYLDGDPDTKLLVAAYEMYRNNSDHYYDDDKYPLVGGSETDVLAAILSKVDFNTYVRYCENPNEYELVDYPKIYDKDSSSSKTLEELSKDESLNWFQQRFLNRLKTIKSNNDNCSSLIFDFICTDQNGHCVVVKSVTDKYIEVIDSNYSEPKKFPIDVAIKAVGKYDFIKRPENIEPNHNADKIFNKAKEFINNAPKFKMPKVD